MDFLYRFINLELPLIQKSNLFSEDITVFGKNLTIYSKVDNQINSSNIEICAQNMVGRKGLGTNLSLKKDSDSSFGRKRKAKSRSGHP